jgi:death-on-curing family protein
MRAIRIEEVERLAHKLAQAHLTFDEPIPDFSTRYPGNLESCLKTTFETVAGGRDPYRGFVNKAAILFYLMIKNHPFFNGNKRVAVTTLLTFLAFNDKWLKVTNEQLYQQAVEVAQSNPKYMESVVKDIHMFIKDHLEPLDPL